MILKLLIAELTGPSEEYQVQAYITAATSKQLSKGCISYGNLKLFAMWVW